MIPISVFGIVGTGVIGAGWATRALGSVGLTLLLGIRRRELKTDSAPLWPGPGLRFRSLACIRGASPDRITFVDTVEEVCAAADFIQESAPENEEIKRSLHTQMDAAAPPECDHRFQFFGTPANPHHLRLPTPRPDRDRPSLQPGLSAAAVRDRRRRPDIDLRRSSGRRRSTTSSTCTPSSCATRCLAICRTGSRRPCGERSCTWSTRA